MTESQVPWPQVFFDWFGGPASEARAGMSPAAAFYKDAMFAPVRTALLTYTPDRAKRLEHPYFQRSKPASLLIDEIEALWAPIAEHDDWSAFETKLSDIETMRLALA